MRKYFISSVLLLCFFTQITIAQAVDTVKVNVLNEVVVTAQYGPQSEKNAVYKVKVLTQDIIKNKAANNLNELLQQELNLDISQNSVFGSSIQLQGISKENIKILVDGVPVIGRLNGIINLNQINLDNIERVEVIEGPVSVFYGTDAMGGTINLITKTSQNKNFEGSVSAFYESINATNFSGNLGYKFEKIQLQFNAGLYNFKGLSTNSENERNLNWEERNQNFVDLQFIQSFSNLKLRYSGKYSKENLFNVGEPTVNRRGTVTIEDVDYITKRLDNSINLQGEVKENKFLDVTLAYLDYERYHDSYSIDPDTFEETLSTTDLRSENVVKYNFSNIKAQLGKSDRNAKFNYAYGTDFNIESTEGGRILEREKSINTLSFYSSVNYKLAGGIEFQPGLRYSYNSTYNSLISPAFNSKIPLGNNSNLRFSYARGFRAPSLKELYLDFHISAGPFTYIISGNENLEVEKSHSFNLQHQININSFKIESSLFYNKITDLIALSQIVDFKRNYINIDKFKSKGANVSVTFKPINKLSFKTGASIIGRFNKFSEDFESEDFLYAPEFNSTISYTFSPLNINFNLFYKYTGEREDFYIDDEAIIKTSRESFNNMDVNFNKSFANNKVTLSLGVKNVFNVEDIETTNIQGEAHNRDLQLWGRSFFVKTNINF